MFLDFPLFRNDTVDLSISRDRPSPDSPPSIDRGRSTRSLFFPGKGKNGVVPRCHYNKTGYLVGDRSSLRELETPQYPGPFSLWDKRGPFCHMYIRMGILTDILRDPNVRGPIGDEVHDYRLV